MQIGISSFAFGWAVAQRQPPFTALELMEFARSRGAAVVQLADNLPVHRMPPAARQELVRCARAAGITLELGARGLTREHLQVYLGLCPELGATLLRFVVDQEAYEPSPADLTALLRQAAPELKAANVTLAVENHDRFPAEIWRRIIEEAGDPAIGVCLDTANGFGAGQGPIEVARALAPMTVNLHVKDVEIARLPHQMGFVIEGRPLGRGQLPIGAVLDAVRAAGRCRSALVELWTPPAGGPELTIAKEASWAEESLHWLRTYRGTSASPASPQETAAP